MNSLTHGTSGLILGYATVAIPMAVTLFRTGKSTAIRELLTGALDRGDRAIIADPDGGYLRRFKDTSRGDIVLNPFENESLRPWRNGQFRLAAHRPAGGSAHQQVTEPQARRPETATADAAHATGVGRNGLTHE